MVDCIVISPELNKGNELELGDRLELLNEGMRVKFQVYARALFLL